MRLPEYRGKDEYGEIQDLAYTPSGGLAKMIALGIILPAVLVYFGVHAWLREEAIWLGSRGANVEVEGNAAKSLAVVYASVGLLCHFRWFWGLLPVWRVFEIGTAVSLVGIIGGLICAVYYVFC